MPNTRSGAWGHYHHKAQGFDVLWLSEITGGILWFTFSEGKRIHLGGEFTLGDWSDLILTEGGTLFEDDDTEAEPCGYFKLDRTPEGLRLTFDIDPSIFPEYGYDAIDIRPIYTGDVEVLRHVGNDHQGYFLIQHPVRGGIGGHYYGNTPDGQDWLVLEGDSMDNLNVYRMPTGIPFSPDQPMPEQVGTLTLTEDIVTGNVDGKAIEYVLVPVG